MEGAIKEAISSRYPDWCDPSPWLWTFVCEQYVGAPIWCTVFVIDGIAVWIIAAILLRQREQDREDKALRVALPRVARSRHLWGRLAATVRLVSLAAGGTRGTRWEKLWQRMAAARRDRRQYLSRRDFSLSSVLSRASGPLLLVGCTILICFEVNAYLEVGFPWFESWPGVRCAGRYFGFAVGARTALDYARTAFLDPGRPEAEASKASRPQGALGDTELGDVAGHEVRQCRHCQRPKPPRCHHCKVCRRCVLKMDHHCPFVNNCVGLRNYRYFIFFLADLVVGCSLVLFSLCPQVPSMVFARGTPAPTLARRVHVLVAFVVAVIAASALVPFLFFHLQLVLLNKTSLEILGRRPPPTRRSSRIANPGHDPPAAGGGASRGPLENWSEVCGAPPAACAPCAEGLMKRFLLALVPAGKAHLAKRSE